MHFVPDHLLGHETLLDDIAETMVLQAEANEQASTANGRFHLVTVENVEHSIVETFAFLERMQKEVPIRALVIQQ